jgi:hypothetical protein
MNHETHEKGSESFKYEDCFIAFLDILGFKNKVIDSQHTSGILKILIDSLNICGAFPSGGKKVSTASNTNRTISIQSRFFSDTIVFFSKINKEDISHLFLIIRYLQDRLWEKGICLRGAVTNGGMYWPSTNYKEGNIIVGPGLIDAYKLESEVAIYPRILVSQELRGYINGKEIDAFPFGQSGRLKDFIRQDKDEQFFLDLLNRQITRARDEWLDKTISPSSDVWLTGAESRNRKITTDDQLDKTNSLFSIVWSRDTGSKHREILDNVGKIITENIDSKDANIRQKYEWLKSYKENS